jgi:hypothetical protein
MECDFQPERFEVMWFAKSDQAALRPITISLFVLACCAIAGAAHAVTEQTWKTYVDEYDGTRVDYPHIFSIREGKPALGSGERWITPDNRAEIEIYSFTNADHYTPKSYLAAKMRLDPARLHYERVTSRFFAISATANGRIYYSRCNFSGRADNKIHCVYLGYPSSEKREWDQIVTRVSLSLRP